MKHRGRYKQACGHRGLGKECHRCAQADALVAGREKVVEHRGLKMLPALAPVPEHHPLVVHLRSMRSSRLTSRKDNMPLNLPAIEKPVAKKRKKTKVDCEDGYALQGTDPEAA